MAAGLSMPRRMVSNPSIDSRAGTCVPFIRVISTLEIPGGWFSLARALLKERLSLFEGGREIPLHQKGFGEGFSFPAAQDTHFARSPVENNLHDRPSILGWPIRFPGAQSLCAG